MKSRMLWAGFAFIWLGVCVNATFAQSQQREVTRTIGLTASIQSGQIEVFVPIWLGDQMVLAPGVGFVYVEKTGTDLRLLLAPRFYTSMARVAPYFGVRGGALLAIPDGGGSTLVDILVGIAIGGDYFVNPRFSFGVEAQINGTISDDLSPRFGNPGGFNVSTAGAVNVSIYLK